MSRAAALSEEEKEARVAMVQTYITSLLYLREEAARDALEPVARIMWNAIASIEAWLDSRESPISSHDMVNSSLCHGLDLLLKWLSMPPGRRRHAAHLLEGLGKGNPKRAHGTRQRPAVNRRTAK